MPFAFSTRAAASVYRKLINVRAVFVRARCIAPCAGSKVTAMRTRRTGIQFLIGLAALCATASASAELYKWVDERGVTNYSNERPAAAAANKVARVESTISVYTPDDSFLQSVKAMRERELRAMREPETQRPAVGQISTAQSGYEKCVLSGRLGCEDIYNVSAYQPGVAVIPYRRLPQPQPRFTYNRQPPSSTAAESRVR